MLRADQVEALRRIFRAVDRDSSGEISANELSPILRAFATEPLS